MDTAELLLEHKALKGALAEVEARLGPMEPGYCALKQKLEDIEAHLQGKGGATMRVGDWAEMCHICGRQCWL